LASPDLTDTEAMRRRRKPDERRESLQGNNVNEKATKRLLSHLSCRVKRVVGPAAAAVEAEDTSAAAGWTSSQ